MEVGGGDWKPGKALQSSGCAKQWEDSEVLRTMRGILDSNTQLESKKVENVLYKNKLKEFEVYILI